MYKVFWKLVKGECFLFNPSNDHYDTTSYYSLSIIIWYHTITPITDPSHSVNRVCNQVRKNLSSTYNKRKIQYMHLRKVFFQLANSQLVVYKFTPNRFDTKAKQSLGLVHE